MIHPTYTTVLELISKQLPNKKRLRVLDYGCGSGYFLEVMKKRSLEAYVGFDINPKSIQLAKDKYASNHIRFFTIPEEVSFALLKEKDFDVLLLIGVMQYMKRAEITALFKKAKQCMRPDGIIIITCAIDHSFYKVVNVLQLFSPHHLLHRSDVVRLLQHQGFRVRRQFEKGLLLSPVLSQSVMLVDMLDRILFSTQGTIGPIGRSVRSFTNIFLSLEYRLPIDYGYTLFLVASRM